METNELGWRTKKPGLNIVKLVESLPPSPAGKLIDEHPLRSGLYVSLYYRAACRAVSGPDRTTRLGYTIEYIDESIHWMEMLAETGSTSKNRTDLLMQKAGELMAILPSSAQSAREQDKGQVQP